MSEIHGETSLHLKSAEIAIISIITVLYITIRTGIVEVNNLVIAILGFVLALWLILKPTEWAVEGLKMLAQKLGVGNYAAGVIGSIMANLPELILAALLILKGEEELAILTVLIVAGANTLLFGITIILNSKNGKVKVPLTTLKYESELMLLAFITSIFLFVFNLAEEIKNKTTEIGNEPGVRIPVFFSIGTIAVYLVYLYFLATDKSLNPEISEKQKIILNTSPAFQWRNIGKFLLLGTTGVVFAGELLANSAEIIISEAEQNDSFHLSIAGIALIIGLISSLPEWAVALRAGSDIELVFGSVLSSISASLLFLLGLVSLFLFFIGGDFVLDTFAIVQIVLSGSILLFVNMLMKDDHYMDVFEGISISIVQLIGFSVLISV